MLLVVNLLVNLNLLFVDYFLARRTNSFAVGRKFALDSIEV
jgi:hypothetical protein